MKMHELKTIQPFFGQLKTDGKNFEVRYNDRDVRVGDILILSEWAGQAEWTGQAKLAKVTYKIALHSVPNLLMPVDHTITYDPRNWEVFGLHLLEDGKVYPRPQALKIAHKLVSLNDKKRI